MKHKHIVLTILISCLTFSFIGCSKVSNGIPPSPTTSKFLKGADGPPLLIVDNVEKGYLDENSQGKLNPNQIDHIKVLSPASTNDLVSQFGQKGKNGVVLITTKRAGK
ncbi:hypothetical protein [Fibrisoma limi]|uniref:hypothetical protein n=1 Tax=Fibrisoma limi TaxID=663275 RepID=UPI00058778E8|nr:hypothetical protein [Fibrisoma limi]